MALSAASSMSVSGVCIPHVLALLILDAEGHRVCANYYPLPDSSPSSPLYTAAFKDFPAQQAFEKRLFNKTVRASSSSAPSSSSSSPPPPHPQSLRGDVDIVLFEDYLCVYKACGDVFLFCCGGHEENELILQSVIQCYDESIAALLKGHVAKRTLIENIDLVLLAADELIDSGMIIEMDSQAIVSRVCMQGEGGNAGGVGAVGGMSAKEVPIGEQSFTQALQTAKDQLYRSFK